MRSPNQLQATVWLRGVVALALGCNLGACVDEDLGGTEDLAATDTDTGDTGETDEELGPVTGPSLCYATDYVHAFPPVDGSCECDEECLSAIKSEAYQTYNCGQYCTCSLTASCVSVAPDQGECMVGFDVYRSCTGGRPFLVAGELRVAPTRSCVPWTSAGPRPDVPEPLREPVLAAWIERAELEHASVAAFARFASDLLTLGAPAALVHAAQAASLDEARHARVCYAVATHLAGTGLGPGALDIRGLARELDAARVAVETILEGCIGETVAAAQMDYLARRARDPQLALALAHIAADESRHAALAWASLRWMLSRFELRAVVRETFARSLAQSRRSLAPDHDPLAAHGALRAETAEWIASEVMHAVVGPAVAALLADPHRRSAQGQLSTQ